MCRWTVEAFRSLQAEPYQVQKWLAFSLFSSTLPKIIVVNLQRWAAITIIVTYLRGYYYHCLTVTVHCILSCGVAQNLSTWSQSGHAWQEMLWAISNAHKSGPTNLHENLCLGKISSRCTAAPWPSFSNCRLACRSTKRFRASIVKLAAQATDEVSETDLGRSELYTLGLLEWPKLCHYLAKFASTSRGRQELLDLKVQPVLSATTPLESAFLCLKKVIS